MSDSGYKLTKSEIAGQIHRTLKDIYPSLSISGPSVAAKIVRSGRPGSDIKFLAGEFALENGINMKELIDRLYIELQIEYEKNWHDRVFFGIFKGKESLYFRIVDDSTT
jgi:hypothetical protein